MKDIKFEEYFNGVFPRACDKADRYYIDNGLTSDQATLKLSNIDPLFKDEYESIEENFKLCNKNVSSLKLEEMNQTDRLKYLLFILSDSDLDITNKDNKTYLKKFSDELYYIKDLNKSNTTSISELKSIINESKSIPQEMKDDFDKIVNKSIQLK